METRVNEIADHIYRLSTFVPDVGPTGFTFNQFLIEDEQPLLFHTGMRATVPAGQRSHHPDRPARRTAVDHLRPSRGGRVRRNERAPRRGAAGRGRARRARVHGVAQRPRATARRSRSPTARSSSSGSTRVRHIDTPHVPHGWEARVLFEETTSTLLCGDLFSQLGDGASRHQRRHRRRRVAGGGRVRRDRASRPTPVRRSGGSPSSRPRRSRSCTARRSPGRRRRAACARRLLRRAARCRGRLSLARSPPSRASARGNRVLLGRVGAVGVAGRCPDRIPHETEPPGHRHGHGPGHGASHRFGVVRAHRRGGEERRHGDGRRVTGIGISTRQLGGRGGT